MQDEKSKTAVLIQIARDMASVDSEDALFQQILEEAMRLTNADGGTLYMVRDEELHFQIIRNNSLNIRFGGVDAPEIPYFFEPLSMENPHHVCVHVIQQGNTANIPDVYQETMFDFSGAKKMDASTGYNSKSFLTVGMFSRDHSPIGVLQLINATDPTTGKVHAFSKEDQDLVEALAGMGGAVLQNVMLFLEITELLESFIRLIAEAVDKKSPYTGGHCRRVPEIVMGFAEALHNAKDGPFADLRFSDADMYELSVSAWLHDVGKIVIPEYVMDKATKLETIYDRIHEVEFRFELKQRELEVAKWKSVAQGTSVVDAEALYQEQIAQLQRDLAFIRHSNMGKEFMSEEDMQRIQTIAKTQVSLEGVEQDILPENFVHNLLIRAGTLTAQERKKINEHMDVTIQMLESLPFPRHLKRVPEFAGGHHETMIGTGYPKGLTKDQMSVQARMMAIADVFEALTASDRPYKAAKSLSETMGIMTNMKKNHHLDPDLLNEFMRLGVYKPYVQAYMAPELIDNIDVDAMLLVEPKKL